MLGKLYIQRNIGLERDTRRRTVGAIPIARTWTGRKFEKVGKHALWRDRERALNARESFERFKRSNVEFVSDMPSSSLCSKARERC